MTKLLVEGRAVGEDEQLQQGRVGRSDMYGVEICRLC